MKQDDRRQLLYDAMVEAGMEPGKARQRSWHMTLEIGDDIRWANQTEPCSGPGYAHRPHGACPGYASDRT